MNGKRHYQIEVEETSYKNYAFEEDAAERAKPLEVSVKVTTRETWAKSEETLRAGYESEQKFDIKKHCFGFDKKILSCKEISAPFFYKVGDGITESGYSDCYSHTVVAVSKNGKTITVARDHCKQTAKLNFTPGGFVGHFSGEQKWEIIPGTEGYKEVSLRTNGRWMAKGVSANQSGGGWNPGRYEHYDYNF